MLAVLISLLHAICVSMRTRAALQLEILALRHQLHVLQRSRRRRLRLTQADRLLWIGLSRVWNEWRSAVTIVRPETDRVAASRVSTLLDLEEPSRCRPTARAA
jgi:putative transposase